MPICEQKYLAWCEAMTAKAARERSSLAPAFENEAVDESYLARDVSDAESFHSTASRTQKLAVSPKPIRRRTRSASKVGDPETAAYPSRMGTWPRSASHPISRTKTRPSIPWRRSSHLSTSSRNRADLRSFHRESCQLFSSMDATITDSGYSSIHRASSSRFASTSSFSPPSRPSEETPQCSKSLARPSSPTVVSWKSEETRRIEYCKIDEAHSGLRGLWKKILPKSCQSRRSWRRFFEGQSCDGESVRRMRMPFSDEK
jgi:hypothetical protein